MKASRENCALIVPTLNAGYGFRQFLSELRGQCFLPDTLLLLDSESDDGTVAMAQEAGFIIETVQRKDFNHGATRQLALSFCPDANIIIYMTQDAILASPESIKNILAPFEIEKVGAVCGRQLPHADASHVAAHARLFNYPTESSVKSIDDISRIGIKAAFISNSFAAYRRTALFNVGGFPSNAILSEDTHVVAKMLQNGWKLAYAADATCYHSHNYSIMEEFRRYFDIGVFHGRESWYLAMLGKAEGEGIKFIISEISYLFHHAPWQIPFAMGRTALKLFGYKLGQREKDMPLWLKRKLSMNKGYWNTA